MGKTKRKAGDPGDPVGSKRLIGSERVIYKKRGSDGKDWKTSEGGLVDSIIGKYLRDGGSLTGGSKAKKQRLQDASLFAIEAMAVLDSSREDKQKRSYQSNTIERWSGLENFMLEAMPNSPFTKMLIFMKNEDRDKDDDVTFNPITDFDLAALWKYYLTPKSVILHQLGDVTGRGVSYPTISKLASAINELHKLAGKTSPFDEYPMFRDLLRALKKSHKTVGAASLNYASHLKDLYHANFGDEKKSSLQKIRDWAMILMVIAFIARGSEDVQTIEFPTLREEWGQDKIPNKITHKLRGWKGCGRPIYRFQ